MDTHHNNQIISRNFEKLRSNSIKNPAHHSNNIGAMLKVNAKKFPVDFFSRNQMSACKARASNSDRIVGSKTEQRRQQRVFEQLISNQLLPEAQVTSFFKINYQSTETSETVPSKSSGLENETKLSVSELDCMISKQVSTSIQLKQSSQRNFDLCCTFSKIPNSVSKLGTPQKKGTTVQLRKMQDENNTQYSARMQRPSTKKQIRGNSVYKKRKSSIERLSLNRQDSNSNNQILNRKLLKKDMVQMLYLPPIAKRQ